MFLKIKFKSVSYLLNRITLVSILTVVPITSMAIVNMDALHFDDKEDSFYAAVDLMVSGASGNSDSAKASLNTQLNWKAKKSINLVILGYQYGENNGVSNVNKAFIHYRYIYQLTDTMDWELFGQLETNQFTRLSYRGLIGTGLRYLLVKSKVHTAFGGVGGFYSREETDYTSGLTDGGVEEFARANFYLLSKYKINPTLNFSNVLYYQPRISRPSDYRALLETKFDFKINKELSFRLSLDIEHDSEPSQSIKKTDISYMTGLQYNF